MISQQKDAKGLSKLKRYRREGSDVEEEAYMVKALSITLVELKDIEEVRTEIAWEIIAFARDIVQI